MVASTHLLNLDVVAQNVTIKKEKVVPEIPSTTG